LRPGGHPGDFSNYPKLYKLFRDKQAGQNLLPEMGNEMKGEHIMSFFDGYRREERARLTPGDYRVAITEVEETTSCSGNPMLVVTVQPNGSEIHIKHYLVKNEYFN